MPTPWVALLPPDALFGRLGLLRGGVRDLPERQQTLRATIDWSYALLTPWERTLVRRLSVFAGGSTLEAAEAVAPRQVGDEDLGSGVRGLVDHGLLRHVGSPGNEPRFLMLETIREYGLEQLAARLHAAASAIRLAIGAPLPPLDRPGRERELATLRAALGDATFATAWALGERLSAGQAVEEALG